MHAYIHTYLHTYIPTYLHTYIHTYMNIWKYELGFGEDSLPACWNHRSHRPIYAINPILMQQTAPERTDSRRNQGFCVGHRIRSLNASNDQPFVGPWLPGLPGLPHLDPGMVQIVASMGSQNQSCYSLKNVEFWRIAKAMWACLKKG